MAQAVFKAILGSDNKMIAALAAIPHGRARFFIRQKRETEELFVGRVSMWIKDQGGEGLEMHPPDLLPKGVPVAEFMLRMRVALGADRSVPADAAEFDVQSPQTLANADADAGEGKSRSN